ncbi:sulfite exporter TauE/SafE family protein [uncultured Draconibacterium sp.]|uniref:sulfite exporter TauE/SafE family protein n=1 Tax=uncultured Draconibacterium sp. TaxID=1573823 RepID=UPI003216E6FB
MFEFSQIESVYYLLPLIGLLIGFFGTILGGGGGFFILPILTLLIGVPAQTAVITSLAATLPICIVGSLGHFNKGNIDFKVGLKFALAGIFGAFIGASITSIITADQLRISFGIYSIVIASNLFISTWKRKRAENNKTRKQVLTGFSRNIQSSVFGFFAGTITGTFGTSGTAPVLAGLFAIRLPFKLIIGTSLLVVLSNTFFAVGAHALIGKIDLTLICFLTAGSVIGAVIGPKFLSKIKTDKSENKLRYLYAAIIVMLGTLMIMD